ncbi:MAG: tetratricopeptide repeat protein [Desulfobacteraceae bacterium]|nr:tetratricopeptide repeat protein [Desulfobacteraceae bacterium]
MFEKGVSLFKQGKVPESIVEFTRLIELSPQDPNAYKNRGVSYMQIQEFDLAIKDFEMVLDLIPSHAGIYSNIGVAWYYKKNYKNAINSYDKEIEISPKNPVVYFNRALSKVELGEIEEAINDLTKALELKPDFYWALCYKGDLLSKIGSHGLAYDTYEKAILVDADKSYANAKLEKLNQILSSQTIEIESKSVEKQKSEPTAQEETQSETNLTSGAPPEPASQAGTTPDLAAATKTKPTIETKIKSRPVEKLKTTVANKITAPLKKKETTKVKTTGYTLQVGAFLSKANAQKLKTRLVNSGFASKVLVLTGNKGKSWHLVRVGQYTTKGDSGQVKKDLKEKMNLNPVIRPAGRF